MDACMGIDCTVHVKCIISETKSHMSEYTSYACKAKCSMYIGMQLIGSEVTSHSERGVPP